MAIGPACVRDVFREWSESISGSVWPRLQVLVFAAIVCVGWHTVCRLLRVAGTLAEGHWSSYHPVLSKRRWSTWRLARSLAQHVVKRFIPDGPIAIVGDDTVTQHPGKYVYGKARHRDAVRSTHSYTAWRWGHKWVVLAIPVSLPGLNRPWALPVLCAMYRSPEENQKRRRRHKTPCDLMRQLLCVLLRWVPQEEFRVFWRQWFWHACPGAIRDGPAAADADQQVLQGCQCVRSTTEAHAGHRGATTRQRSQTAFAGNGRGSDAPSETTFGRVVWRRTSGSRHTTRAQRTGTRAALDSFPSAGCSSKIARARIATVFLHHQHHADTAADHRSRYRPLGHRSDFAEVREHVGLETTRGRCARTILRAEPCLFGLYTLVALWFAELPETRRQEPLVTWTGRIKRMLSFSDAITLVRRQIWHNWRLESPRHAAAFHKLTPQQKHTLLELIAQAL